MKKLLFIELILSLLISCKLLNIQNKQHRKPKTVMVNGYCKIVDSLRLLPKYNYSLVKYKTVFISSDYEDSEQRIKEAEAKGLRGVIMGNVEDPYEIDSIRYSLQFFSDAHSIFRKQITDSLLSINNVAPSSEEVEEIAREKLKKERCTEEDFIVK